MPRKNPAQQSLPLTDPPRKRGRKPLADVLLAAMEYELMEVDKDLRDCDRTMAVVELDRARAEARREGLERAIAVIKKGGK